MSQPVIEQPGSSPAETRSSLSAGFRLGCGSITRGLVIALAVWIVHGFFEAIMAACITAVASWPLYTRFANRIPARMRASVAPPAFTCLMIVFVLAPMVFAAGALLGEAHALLQQVAAADQRGIAPPQWLADMPLVGPWMLARWQRDLAQPGTLLVWTQQTDPALLLGWAQALGQFSARHALIIVFTILLLFFLYQHGDALAQAVRGVLRQRLGAGVERYIGLGTRAVRASVNSMLVVGLFDGLAAAAAFALIGVPQAVLWAAITGALALVPFLGYVAVAALGLHLVVQGATTTALLALALGGAILLAGDKVVRPAVAGAGVSLPFVWVLIGCLGGFEVLGLVGLVIGPVVLVLARELWEQRVRDAAAGGADGAPLAEARTRGAARPAEAGPAGCQGGHPLPIQ